MSLKRRKFLRDSLAMTAASAILPGLLTNCSKTPPPNILWLIAEDLGPDLECYRTKRVKTPHLNRLAEEGILFTQAFTTAPVCSASRSAFMTGMYQTSIDAHHHRSHREDNYQLSAPVKVVTEYFQQAGYFTSNCSGLAFNKPGKTDWNFTPAGTPFNGTDWRERQNGQPFFAQINFGEVHRMGNRPHQLTVDPERVELPP